MRLEQSLRTEAGASVAGPAAQLKREAAVQAARGDQRRALNLFAAALAADFRDAQSWLGFARAASAVTPADDDERYRLGERALAAAYLAYGAPGRARRRRRRSCCSARSRRRQRAVAAGAERLSRRASRSPTTRRCARPTRSCARSTASASPTTRSIPTPPRRASASSSPSRWRAARSISRPSSRSPAPPTPPSRPRASSSASTACSHGERYAVVVRQGLPSAVGESAAASRPITRSTSATARRRCASPAATTSCRAPARRACRSSRSTPRKVDVEIFRIGDRSLLPTVRSDDFLAQLGRYSADEIAEREGRARSGPARST